MGYISQTCWRKKHKVLINAQKTYHYPFHIWRKKQHFTTSQHWSVTEKEIILSVSSLDKYKVLQNQSQHITSSILLHHQKYNIYNLLQLNLFLQCFELLISNSNIYIWSTMLPLPYKTHQYLFLPDNSYTKVILQHYKSQKEIFSFFLFGPCNKLSRIMVDLWLAPYLLQTWSLTLKPIHYSYKTQDTNNFEFFFHFMLSFENEVSVTSVTLACSHL